MVEIPKTARAPMSWRRRVTLLALLGCVGGIAGIATLGIIRLPQDTTEMRGARLANDMGCFACHGPGGLRGAGNPEARGNHVPPFNAGGPLMSYMYNEAEISEWIEYGAPRRMWVNEQPPPSTGIAGGVIKMPGYKAFLTKKQTRDLVAYVKSVAGWNTPADELAAEGHEVAERNGCFGCHGQNGQGGFANPRSFKGYIPPWNGKDYLELVKNDEELTEWILFGSIKRFSKNPAARFFIDRMSIHMPAYQDNITEHELQAIVAYIKWLRDPRRKAKRQFVRPEDPLTDSKVARGRFLFDYVGCAACHNNEGKGDIVNPNAAGDTVPALNDLAEKLQLFREQDSKLFIAMLERGADLEKAQKEPPFPGYEAVFETFVGTRNLIVRGGVPHGRDPNGPAPPMQMPAWSERMHSDDGPASLADLDAVIAYLLTLSPWEEIEAQDTTKKVATSGFPFPADEDYTPLVRDFRTEFKKLSTLEFSGLHGNRNLQVYINKNASAFVNNHQNYRRKFEADDDDAGSSVDGYVAYPAGTIIVAAHYDPKIKKVTPQVMPDFVTMMLKRAPGYDPDNGNWQYVKVTNKGRVIVDGSAQNYAARVVCVECHRNVRNRDNIFATFLSEE